MNKVELYNSPLISELSKEVSSTEQHKIENKMLLALRIDEVLKSKGWKKKDLANALGKTASEITKWLSGTHNFTIDTLFDVEKVLNITLIQLEQKPLEVFKTYKYFVSSELYICQEDFSNFIINYKPLLKSFKAKFSDSKVPASSLMELSKA